MSALCHKRTLDRCHGNLRLLTSNHLHSLLDFGSCCLACPVRKPTRQTIAQSRVGTWLAESGGRLSQRSHRPQRTQKTAELLYWVGLRGETKSLALVGSMLALLKVTNSFPVWLRVAITCLALSTAYFLQIP